jgi:shikimate dehydrogenase
VTERAARRFGVVIGAPVEHSLSPALHTAAFAATGIDATFVARHVEPADLPAVIAEFRATRPLGISVTVPHKHAVVALLDRIEPPADRIGAVNCIAVEADGALVGHNTDAGGFVDGAGDVSGARAVLLGAGGAARAVYAGLESAGAARIDVVARAPAKASWVAARPWTADTLGALLPACDVLVDCTSMGLDPAREAAVPAPVDVALLPDGALVATLVYHRETALCAAARARGLRTLDGGPMLVHQGARAFTLWTGKPAPVDAMSAALAAALSAALKSRGTT